MKRILSGVQPTGDLHLGNYLGALTKFVAMQDEDADRLFCVVDLHAITVKQDPKELRRKTREIAAAFLASGVDPDRSTIFVQSMIHQHSELNHILQCQARMGQLARMPQFKDKAGISDLDPEVLTRIKERYVSGGHSLLDVQALYDALVRANDNREKASLGLFTYPVLQAADILLYRATHVPVGADQKHHIELTRDLAQRFNQEFEPIFTIPEPVIEGAVSRVMSLHDPAKKMSKSDPNPNATINLTDDADTIRRKVKKATATSEPIPERLEDAAPQIRNMLAIFAGVTGDTLERIHQDHAGVGFGVFKPALADAIADRIVPIGEEMKRLMADTSEIDRVLLRGRDRALEIAQATMIKVKDAVGFI